MKFYNSGKYNHQVGRHKDTGEMVESIKDLKPAGHDVGTCIVNFPGSGFYRVVKAGEWVETPYDLSEDAIKSACPSLLTEAEYAALPVAQDKNQPAAKPVKG